MDLSAHFRRASRSIPIIAAGTLRAGGIDVAAKGDLDPETSCWEIGSITKVFTGVLLAEMSLRGHVALDDPIGAYLPGDLDLPPISRQPTLLDLATHTAGLPRLPLEMVRTVRRSADPYAELTYDDVLRHLGPRTTRPRRPRRRYSNFGMGLLGHLLATAAGQPYAEVLAERVLDPLGLCETRVGGCGDERPAVQGIRRKDPTPAWTFGALHGAGALRSTVPDLLRFAAACIDPPAGSVGEALRSSRRTHRGGSGPRGGTGLGWMIRTPPGRRPAATWHTGGTYGAASFLAVGIDRPIAVVAFGNRGPGLIGPLDAPSWSLFDSLAE
jgi:D-alanyl-D-alanine-carboxypeptidase/D-alanyl-D-alanine-endopeptidase